MKKNIKLVVLEALLIFGSVFLGILAGDWNESRKEQQRTNQFLENLTQEVAVNKKRLQASIPYHELIGNAGDSLFQNAPEELLSSTLLKVGGLSAIPHWRGMGSSALETSVFDSGVLGNTLSRVPVGLLLQISRVYSFQEEYERFNRSLADKLLNMNTDTKLMDLLVIVEFLGGDVLTMEKQLVETYDQLSAELEQAVKN